jgi:DNA-binding HxlR family transcriptional regulator
MERKTHHLCAKFQRAMDVLARPWNGLIIATLDKGALRFTELGNRLEVVGDRMLALRLKELEALGLVERRVQPGPPVRVDYQLTEVGRGFREVEAAIQRWGESFLELPAAPVEKRRPRAAAGRAAAARRPPARQRG